ncbi:MAG: phosphoribosylaminoimidazolesuccinocarboxamide synthase [Methanomicrobiales archaeon]|nr:phosphoribosylaminoimidazolesuccinocarboxamide synthase [Methanomicrobiales archaeon]
MKKGTLLYGGKAKTVYKSERPGCLVMEFRDDITAFDGGKKAVMKGKGRYNCCVSAFFFQMLEEKGVPTHFIRMLDDHTLLVRALSMIPLEIIIRNIAAGSLVRNFPFTEGQKIDPPLVVIDLKDDSRHDPMLNDDLILALDIVTEEELRTIKEMALHINEIVQEFLSEKGIILVDFKLEFGRTEGGIVVGDEISMDSMRLWDANTRQSLDKDVYRFDKGDVIAVYREVARQITRGKCEV